MKAKGLLTDRRILAGELERLTGKEAIYMGAPSFRYRIGPFTVLRDGSLDAPDGKEAETLLSVLREKGLIDGAEEETALISICPEKMTGRVAVNLGNMIASKGALLNKAIGEPNAFRTGRPFVKALRKTNPSGIKEFMDVLHAYGGEKAMRGLKVTGEKFLFTGFPDRMECRLLAERMAETAQSQRWIKADPPPIESEKYTFRVWLNSLGMKGTKYREARLLLMKNLEGDSSFRTEAQKEAFYQGRKRRIEEAEFILL